MARRQHWHNDNLKIANIIWLEKCIISGIARVCTNGGKIFLRPYTNKNYRV